jgi:hypothetical protein
VIKFFGDNLIDNLNQSAGILGKELTKIELQRNLYDIILESSTSAQPIIFADKNLLDGFECSITLSVQNSIEVCEDFVLVGVGNENIIYKYIGATGPAGLDGVVVVMEHQE